MLYLIIYNIIILICVLIYCSLFQSFLSNLERAVGQSIERMDIPNNELINTNRISKLQNKLIKATSTNRENEEETNVL